MTEKRARRTFSEEQKKQLVELFNHGKPRSEIIREYLDYSHDERFSRARAYFVDTDHLTSDGSAAFMKLFFQDLKQYYPD